MIYIILNYTADITPPQLHFNNTPTLSNENTTISWHYNEEASSFCVLQTPSNLNTVPCSNEMVILTDLQDGYHTLYVQGTDSSNNTATTVQLAWTVGMIFLYLLMEYSLINHASQVVIGSKWYKQS